ncbi:mannosyl-oligosaccharide 1,2-alpha-mannosidase IC [Plectosphaerella plurivora]|uniref:alpha-1,2-Mannosidase n=1 Tax=Plectosphaerella plurivora TaxID=936078 RepID=A0A9P8VGP6_9PEZI|nr:mannosyl-oligosaccharide 1,2-alpha-mannosidase IC [Plectosphaerella plurivora]
MASPSASRCQPRLVLGMLCLAVLFSVTLVARECSPLVLTYSSRRHPEPPTHSPAHNHETNSIPERYSVPENEMATLPEGEPLRLPRVQFDFTAEKKNKQELRRHIHASAETQERQQAVKSTFQKAWSAYTQNAWGCDELRPLSQACANHHNGWGAAIIDSLDTLWMMGMHDEFQQAVDFVARIDWNNSTRPRCNPHIANIQYLGGLLSAYDLSHDPILLEKATELGGMLYSTFDTPSRLPPFVFSFQDLHEGKLMPDPYQSAAALGSLSLEFTRLAQLTGQNKYFDAIDRIMQGFSDIQGTTLLPGLWPAYINVRNSFEVPSNVFRMGGDSDALYEYLPKMYALLGGLNPSYEQMYRRASTAARNNLLFRPMVPESEESSDILFLGAALVDETSGKAAHLAEMDHHTCSAGGTFALAGRLLSRPEDVKVGESLARGCAWAYSSTPSGLMPEKAQLLRCPSIEVPCAWDEDRWLERLARPEIDSSPRPQSTERLPRGFWRIDNPRNLLRPEAAESLFVLYRVTGKNDLRDAAWDMFRAMERAAATSSGDVFAALADVTWPFEDGAAEHLDEMGVFFQTLKYFYLIFSDPGFMSLDDWVFNTEAHPLRRPGPA